MTAVSPAPRLTRGTHLGYALGSIGTAAFGTVPGLLLLYYLTDELGVAAGLAGLVVFAPKAWDVVLNPWIGSRSDRTQSRWGPAPAVDARRRPRAAAAVRAGLRRPELAARRWRRAWVAVAFLLAATAYGCFQVPYVAQPAEITDDPGERATLMSWRVAALALGILLAGGRRTRRRRRVRRRPGRLPRDGGVRRRCCSPAACSGRSPARGTPRR